MAEDELLMQTNLAYRRPDLYDFLTADDDVVTTMAAIVDGFGVRPRSILDLGCGTGRHSAALGQCFDAAVVGVDLQRQMIDYGRRSHGADLRVGDMRSVRVGQRFDLITCLGNSLAYLHTRDDLLAAARTIRAHAHGGSMAVISTLVRPPTEPARRVARLDNEHVTAVVEVESQWDPDTEVLTTRRSWQHDDGIDETDLLRRRVVAEAELRSIFQLAGFSDVRSTGLPDSDSTVACIVALP